MIDGVGPIRPAVRGFHFVYHASCPFSHYCWFAPGVDTGAEDWAKFLVEQVFFDVAGFPAVLRSDRGDAFISGVVRAVNDMLGVEQAFGAAWHPQSQGHVEGGHNRLNYVLSGFCAGKPHSWPLWTRMAQWAVRSTPCMGAQWPHPLRGGDGLEAARPSTRVVPPCGVDAPDDDRQLCAEPAGGAAEDPQ